MLIIGCLDLGQASLPLTLDWAWIGLRLDLGRLLGFGLDDEVGCRSCTLWDWEYVLLLFYKFY